MPQKKLPQHPAEKLVNAPFHYFNGFWRWGSSNRGALIFFGILKTYSVSLGIEALVVAFPPELPAGQTEWTAETREAANRDRRFVPKPYVNDGAKLGRINPFPPIANAVNSLLLDNLTQDAEPTLKEESNPLKLTFNAAKAAAADAVDSAKDEALSAASDKAMLDTEQNLWVNSPSLLVLSIVGCLIIQNIESKPLRKGSIEDTRKKFEKTNKEKRAKPASDAIPLANVQAAEVNSYGLGKVGWTFLGVALVYAAELIAFAQSFSTGAAGGVKLLYLFLTVFGFEICEAATNDD